MPFDATAFKQNIATKLGISTPKPPSTPPAKPAAPSFLPSLNTMGMARQSNAQSTSPTPVGRDTKDVIVGGVKLLNPLQAKPVRPAFARDGEEVPLYGGGLITGAHDIAARTLESIPNIALKTAANVGQVFNQGKSTKIRLPFDASRIGVKNPNESRLVAADLPEPEAAKVVQEYKRKGKDAYIENGQVYAREVNRDVTDTGTQLADRFTELQKKNPGKDKTNMALAFIEGPITDALNAFVVGDLATSAARKVLRATRYTPDLEFAFQTYGIPKDQVTGEQFTRDLTKRFNAKARRLVAANDIEGLNKLGYATNILLTRLTGRGVPQLNRIGQVIENTARTALQDAKFGFRLQHPLYPELSPETAATGLPGMREVPGQAPALGMSTRRFERVGGAEEPFQGFDDLSTKILEKLRGKTTTSKQEIMDFTNSPDVRQPEKDLIRDVLAGYGDQVDVNDFANKVKSELLPLNRRGVGTRYENVTLPTEVRGPVADYQEHVYESPVSTSAGDVHYSYVRGEPVGSGRGAPRNYFAHSRVEDLPVEGDKGRIIPPRNMSPENQAAFNKRAEELASKGSTRRVIEIQSDLFQKGRLEKEAIHPYKPTTIALDGEAGIYDDKPSISQEANGEYAVWYDQEPYNTFATLAEAEAYIKEKFGDVKPDNLPSQELVSARNKELSKLEPYRNTWHERLIREEVKQAAKDGKTKLQFPTGETAMKIEGLGSPVRFNLVEPLGDGTTRYRQGATLDESRLKVGAEVTNGGAERWIITDVLGDGKFKAVPKGRMAPEIDQALMRGEQAGLPLAFEETFDISGKVDTENPIYKFYEKEVGKYLKNKYGAERVTDAQGQTWWEVPVTESATGPVYAYGVGAGVGEDEDENGNKKVTFNPVMAALGIVGARLLGPEFKGLSEIALKELAASTDTKLIRNLLVENAVMAPVADRIAASIARATTPDEVTLVLQNEANLLNEKVKYPEIKIFPTEEESWNILANQNDGWKPELAVPLKTQVKIDSDLEQVFADLKGVSVEDLNQSFTDNDMDEARMAYEFALETLLDHPGRALMKYVSRTTGELPEFTGKATMKSLTGAGKEVKSSEWTQRGDDIFQDLIGQELSRGGDVTEAQRLVDEYRDFKSQVAAYRENLRNIRKTVQLQKGRNKFVESSKRAIARQVAENVAAIKNLTEAARKAGYRQGVKKGSERLYAMIKRLKNRRTMIGALQREYNLTNPQMRDINDTDARFMSDTEFQEYFTKIEEKAVEQHQKNVSRQIIEATVFEKELNKTENLRRAMELPPLKKMSLEQLQEFENALAKYEKGDTFLGPRMIQTIENTDLSGVKTVREIREGLMRETGVDPSELKDVRWQLADDVTYDAALMEKNPLYRYMVTSLVAKEVEYAQKLQFIREKLNKLATVARKSRPGSTADKLVPQDKEVFAWLETAEEEQAAYAQLHKMTSEELEYANFVKELYREWRDILIEKGTLKKWRDSYVTHTTRSFFEQWKDDGFVNALGGIWQDLTDQRIDFDAFGDTGQVLGLEKFFKYSIPRTGNLKPSQNVAKVVMSYANSFYKKQALDSMIPKLEAYTFSLQRPNGVGKMDPTGKNIDGKLRQFVKKWLNNKKGRRSRFLVPQGGRVDGSLRAFRLFLSLTDLGVNIISQTAQSAGAVIANFAGLETKAFVKGLERSATKQGLKILEKYPGVVGEVPYQRLMDAMNDIGDTLTSGAFVLMSEIAYRAKGQYFLGSLTEEEFKTGVVSAERQASIKLDMHKFHPAENMESIVGGTPEGTITKMYKTWAVPFLFTALRNAEKAISIAKEAESLQDGVEKLAKDKEVRQLLKLTIGAVGAYLFWNAVMGGDDPKDKSPGAVLKRRIGQELTSSLSALDPNTWLSIRPLTYLQQLAKAMKDVVFIEKYQSTTASHDKGDLKGLSEFGQLLTPSIIRQFTPGKTGKESTGSRSKSAPTNPSLKRLRDMRDSSPSRTNPSLDRLKEMRRAGSTSNPALQRLRDLRGR